MASQAMFYSATAFNSDVNAWNVASVTTMQVHAHLCCLHCHACHACGSAGFSTIALGSASDGESCLRVASQGMFYSATSFNSDVNAWNVASVRTMGVRSSLGWWQGSSMQGIFNRATSFNSDVNTWNVASVTTMQVHTHLRCLHCLECCVCNEHACAHFRVLCSRSATHVVSSWSCWSLNHLSPYLEVLLDLESCLSCVAGHVPVRHLLQL